MQASNEKNKNRLRKASPHHARNAVLLRVAGHSSDMLITTDADFHIDSWNNTAAATLGFGAEEVINTPLWNNIAEEPASVQQQLTSSGCWKGKINFTQKNGKQLLLDCSLLSEKDEHEQVYFILIAQPVPTRSSNSILREQVRSKPFINALAEGLVVRNAAGKILLCNKAAQQITGATKKQMADTDFLRSNWNYIAEDGSPFPFEKYPAFVALETGKPQKNIVIGVERAEGQISWINVNSHPVIQEPGRRVIGTVTSFTDITAIRQAQEELIQSEAKWRSVLDNSKNGVFLLDREGHILLFNKDAQRRQNQMTGPIQIKEGMPFTDLLPPARREPVRTAIERVFKGEMVEYEVVYSNSNSEDLWLLVNYAPVRDNEGKINAVCIITHDVTSLKKKEADLIRSEQRWKFALDGAGDGVWEYNFQTFESYYSPVYKTMLGFTEEEFQNEVTEWHSRIHPDDLEKVNSINDLYENGTIEKHEVEYRMKNKAGEYMWVLDRGMLLERTPDGRPLILIGTHKNIHEQKTREEKLIQSRKLFSSFMENTPTMTWIIDEHAVFRYLNEPYMRAFNLTRKDIGRSIYDIFPKRICDGFIKNNKRVWETGKALETIEEGVGPGGEEQLYQIFKFPLQSEDGVKLLGGVALDITQKVLLEQQLAEEQEKSKREIIQAILNAQENERKELAYELHDNVNQILSSSRLMLEVAVEKPELSGDFVKRSLSYLQDAITELRKISHMLIPGTLRDISLEAALEEVIQNVNSTEKLHITYQKNVNGHNHRIRPEVQLAVLRIAQEQFNNILKHSGASDAFLSLDIDANGLRLTIEDNGNGFDPATTRKGLGLNNIFNRVEYYRGTVMLDSSLGSGCKLQIELPL